MRSSATCAGNTRKRLAGQTGDLPEPVSESAPPSDSVCVVHLVRAANGPEPLRAFIDSYGRHPAGIEHELLVVFKGFSRAPSAACERILEPVPHRRVFVPDEGYDVNVYFDVARNQDAARFCFLNSFSAILAPDWLRKLDGAIASDGVGLAGATGSWQSIFSDYENVTRVLPPMLPHHPAWKQLLGRRLPLLRRLRFMFRRWTLRGSFGKFPNYHIRTNAFMLRRETALRVRVPPIRRKFDAYLFESGKESLTMQVLAMGLRALVVTRDGTVYEKDDWCCSNTFWRGDQENLLVADNQTRNYAAADAAGRLAYSTYAWGAKADSGAAS